MDASSYQETQVLTATPQKLQLLMIEGAIRFARQAARQYREGNIESGYEALVRCRSILAEMLSGVRADEGEVARRAAGVYLYLFQLLTEAHRDADAGRIDDVIRVLDIERETWQMICEKWPQPLAARHDAAEVVARGVPAIAPVFAPPPAGFDADGAFDDSSTPGRSVHEGGFSLEA